jgi:hypothetical protein
VPPGEKTNEEDDVEPRQLDLQRSLHEHCL